MFANFSYIGASATTINSAEYEFPPDELAYIATHHILLDHEGQYTVSGGGAYAAHGNRAYVDVQYGYGLRAGFANLDKQPSYATINTGGEHRFSAKGPTLRLDVVNLFDHRYQIRDGSGLGISAAQWGRRRSIFVGVAQKF